MTCAILEDGYRSGVNKGMIMDYIVEEKSNLGLDMQATEERIGGLIKHAGMSERTMAEHMNLSVQAINKWKHGKSLPDIENMYILSQILGKKVDDLLVPRVDVRRFMIECDSTCYDHQMQNQRIREYFSLLSHWSFQPQVE